VIQHQIHIDKLYINYKGENLIRIKVKAPNEKAIEGQVDILIDIIGEKVVKHFYSTNSQLVDLGYNIDSISWHSYFIQKGSAISVPKVHFKYKDIKHIYDSGDFVNYNNIIPYPVLTLVLYKEWRSTKKYSGNAFGKAYDIEEMLPVCIDIFILPKNIKARTFLEKYDASFYVITSCNTIFLDIFNGIFEECHYRSERFPIIEDVDINGWDIIIRKSNPALFTRVDTFPPVSMILYDLKNAVSSLLDRKIGYPDKDGKIIFTTFRDRLKR